MGIKPLWVKSLALIIVAGLVAACGREADVPDEEVAFAPTQAALVITRTTICHFTGLQTLPYIAVEVSDEAVANHQTHVGDIIPAPVEGCPAQADPSLFQSAPAGTDPTAVAVVATTDPALPVSSTATTAPTLAPTQVALCPPEGVSIQTVLDSTSNLSNFRTMLQNAGWLDALKDTRITMFVPTDEAIAQMNPQLTNELARNQESMNAFLLYHILADRWDLATLGGSNAAQSISGEWIAIENINNEIVFNRYVRVLTADMELCNGLIHIIDHVLIPPIFLSDQRPTPTAVPTNQPQPTNPPSGGGNGGGNDNPPPLAPPTSTPRPTNTPRPTATATPRPTSTPRPTNTPDPTDTSEPTDTPRPTATRTPDPTDTAEPTNTPTDEPTSIPTEVPTDIPTTVPTDVPTDTPTDAPTDSPTTPPTEEGGG